MTIKSEVRSVYDFRWVRHSHTKLNVKNEGFKFVKFTSLSRDVKIKLKLCNYHKKSKNYRNHTEETVLFKRNN